MTLSEFLFKSLLICLLLPTLVYVAIKAPILLIPIAIILWAI